MSRGLTFWNDDTIKLIKEKFVAASVPTWVCRAKSPEGEFLRGAGIHKQWVTSSGYMTCVSASGKLLGRRPSKQVLEKFKELPEEERKAGAIKVPDLKPSERVIPSPPNGGLVLRVHARFLTLNPAGKLLPATTADFPLMRAKPKVMRGWEKFLHPNTEYMWLTQAEWKSLIPSKPAKGQKVRVRSIIPERMARFHLTPKRATTSEGGIVRKRAVRVAQMDLIVESVSPTNLRMRAEGQIHWGSDYDAKKATSPNGPLRMGFESRLYGHLVYDRKMRRFTRFDLVASGWVWGRWGDANNRSMVIERPGRAPFGFALELATGDTPTDRIPPGGNGHYVSKRTGYFQSSKDDR